MFSKNEIRLLHDSYFTILRSDVNFYEIISKNTEHYWIIQKKLSAVSKTIFIYHKHSLENLYYHKHSQSLSVTIAIKLIKEHDEYVLNINL